MKNKKAIYRKLIKNKGMVGLLVILFIFPLIVGGLYALPLPQIIAVDAESLLAYYATVFGIIGSFITYRHELNKRKKERIRELKPTFIIEVTQEDKQLNIFKIDIINHSKQQLSFLYFYDEFISAIVEERYTFKTTYNKTISEEKVAAPDYNITMDPKIIDEDDFPKYIQLLCDDGDGNAWNCYYYKVNDCNKIYYYPRDFEII